MDEAIQEGRLAARGSGLGLAIVKRVVELHHGNVSVAEGPDARGAAFTVRLPLLSVKSDQHA